MSASAKSPTAPAIMGHGALLASLGRAIRDGSLPATVLVHGARGCGKQTLALWMARTSLCAEPAPPCERCASCRVALRLEHADIHWYFPLPRPKGTYSPAKMAEALEDARLERLEEYRRARLRPPLEDGVVGIYLATVLGIRSRAHKRPALGDAQWFVIGDAEHLVSQEASPEAANALLKLLEEPPSGSRFVLTSSRPDALLETIRSRALPVHLPPLPTSEVASFLERECGADSEAATLAATLSQGSIGSAMGHLDADGASASVRRDSLELLRAALERRRSEYYTRALGLRAGGARGLLGLLGALQLWLRDLAATSVGREERVANIDELAFLRGAAVQLSATPDRLGEAMDRIEEATALATANVNPQLLIGGLLLELEAALHGAARPGGAA